MTALFFVSAPVSTDPIANAGRRQRGESVIAPPNRPTCSATADGSWFRPEENVLAALRGMGVRQNDNHRTRWSGSADHGWQRRGVSSPRSTKGRHRRATGAARRSSSSQDGPGCDGRFVRRELRPMPAVPRQVEIAFRQSGERHERISCSIQSRKLSRRDTSAPPPGARTFGCNERLGAAGSAGSRSATRSIKLRGCSTGHPALNTEGLSYVDECARNKVLDVVGDLALAGMPLCGKPTARARRHTSSTRVRDGRCGRPATPCAVVEDERRGPRSRSRDEVAKGLSAHGGHRLRPGRFLRRASYCGVTWAIP